MVSATGATDTVTVAGALTRPDVALVAVTVKLNTWLAVNTGTLGVVKVTLEPVVEDRVMPGGAVQVKVTGLCEAESTAVALRVTSTPLFTVMELPLTVGAAGVGNCAGPVAIALVICGTVTAGGRTMGTSRVVLDTGTALPSPTCSENVRFCGEATSGATKVAWALVGLLMTTGGSLGFITCFHKNGPVAGVLALASRVTITPAKDGLGVDVALAVADEALGIPLERVSGGGEVRAQAPY